MASRNKGLIGNIGHVKGSFALAFFCMFVLLFTFLSATDTLPEVPNAYRDVPALFGQQTQVAVDNAQPEEPVRIKISAVGVDVSVSNPNSTDLAVLDKVLLNGAARYPDSARLGEDGTVLLFGHSSSLPIVHNQNYKSFNGIQNLHNGSVISVFSGTTEYRYSVTGVRLANANEDVVELPTNGKFLTLVTCNNSIANKVGRYVVTAEFVEAYQISQ
ncbi:sortase [Candidatus Parcubacteria bacterium]|nr:sortase [Candidatus Parcubacteria bacterium]